MHQEAADGASAGSALIRVQIIPAKAGQERVKKTTAKGNEVVEVDGFTFIRKRPPPPPAEQAAAKKAHLAAPQQQVQAAVQEPAAAPAAQGGQLSLESDAQHMPAQECNMVGQDVVIELRSHTEVQQHPSEEPVQVQQAAPAEPAVPLHERVTQQLQECLPEACPTPVKLQFVVSQIMQSTSSRHQQQASPQQEEQVAGTPAPTADAAGAAHALAARFSDLLGAEITGAQQLLVQPGSEALAQFQSLPPMLQRAAQAGGLALSLRAQLAALQQEESQWLSLQARYQQLEQELPAAGGAPPQREPPVQELDSNTAEGGAEVGSRDAQGTSSPQQQGGQPESRPEEPGSTNEPPVTAAAESSQQGTGVGIGAVVKDLTGLRATRSAVRGSMTIHVECLLGLVNKVEMLVGRAEQAAASLQAEYHCEKFRSYPHINSPAFLIKQISQAPPPLGAGIPAPSPLYRSLAGGVQGVVMPPHSPLNL